MAYSTSFVSNPTKVCHYLFNDEDNANMVSPLGPSVFYTSNPNCSDYTIISYQELHEAVLGKPQELKIEKPETKLEKLPLSIHNEEPVAAVQSFDASNDNKWNPIMQGDKFLTLNELSEYAPLDLDLLKLDDLFIAFITGVNPPMIEPDVCDKGSAFPDCNIPHLDEFFIIDKMPHTVNDLTYHSSKDNLVELQQDILASYFYTQYLEQFLSVMPSKTQIDGNSADGEDEALLNWIELMAYAKDDRDLPPNDDTTVVAPKKEDCKESVQSFEELLHQDIEDLAEDLLLINASCTN
ncbi:hypothetical protein INT47_009213 [Mucor saturninus]|uniref:Uncharacterized protein n=1 Tax=Mucor saturninus TaxID=64648 RepID=A0A8H7RL70_9FUNG|nr:hypothetical protein INT47_009213 [Mucor saturninus]